MSSENGNNGNGNNGNGNNGNGNNYSYVNKNGFRVNVRPISREGASKKVPNRGQRSHTFSADAYLLHKSHPHTIKERHNKIEANRKQRIRNARTENKRARTNKTRRGPKGDKLSRTILSRM